MQPPISLYLYQHTSQCTLYLVFCRTDELFLQDISSLQSPQLRHRSTDSFKTCLDLTGQCGTASRRLEPIQINTACFVEFRVVTTTLQKKTVLSTMTPSPCYCESDQNTFVTIQKIRHTRVKMYIRRLFLT